MTVESYDLEIRRTLSREQREYRLGFRISGFGFGFARRYGILWRSRDRKSWDCDRFGCTGFGRWFLLERRALFIGRRRNATGYSICSLKAGKSCLEILLGSNKRSGRYNWVCEGYCGFRRVRRRGVVHYGRRWLERSSNRVNGWFSLGLDFVAETFYTPALIRSSDMQE